MIQTTGQQEKDYAMRVSGWSGQWSGQWFGQQGFGRRLCTAVQMRRMRWWRVWNDFGSREGGVSVVLFALALTMLLGFAGLAIDGSHSYLQSQRMQIAADAAALGGARLLALGFTTAQARSEAQTLGAANGSDPIPHDDVTFLKSGTEIEVVATRTFDTFFASVVGYDSMTVSATARASFLQVKRQSGSHLLPLAIPCSDVAGYTIGTTYTMKDERFGPGNFGWLTWDGSTSAPTLEANIRDISRSGEWEVGDWIQGSTGQMNSSGVRAALNELIANQTVVTVPLFDQTRGQGSNFDYHVCGFAEFVLVGYDTSSKTLSGKFVRALVRGEPPTGGSASKGAYDVRITR